MKYINTVAKTSPKIAVGVTPNEFTNYCVQAVDDIVGHISRHMNTAFNSSNVNHSLVQSDRPEFVFQEVTPDVILSIVNNFKPSNGIDVYMSSQVIY